MHWTRLLLFGAISACSMSSHSMAQPVRISAPSVEQLLAKYDIAGVRLGMTPDQARSALLTAGYTFDEKTSQQFECGWDCALEKLVAQRQLRSPRTFSTKVVRWLGMQGPRGQFVEVSFSPTDRGQVATTVRYAIPISQISDQDFQRQMISKFGNPSINENARIMAYCVPVEPHCYNRSDIKNIFPSLGTWGGLSYRREYRTYDLVLSEGTYLQNRRGERLAQIVDGLAPKNARAAF